MARTLLDATGILTLSPSAKDQAKELEDGRKVLHLGGCAVQNKNGQRCDTYRSHDYVMVDGIQVHVCKRHYSQVERRRNKEAADRAVAARDALAAVRSQLRADHNESLGHVNQVFKTGEAVATAEGVHCPECEELVGVMTYHVEDWGQAAMIERKVTREIAKLTEDLNAWHETFADKDKFFSALMRSGEDLVTKETHLGIYKQIAGYVEHGMDWISARDEVRMQLKRSVFQFYGASSTSSWHNIIETERHLAVISMVEREMAWMY